MGKFLIIHLLDLSYLLRSAQGGGCYDDSHRGVYQLLEFTLSL